MKRNKIAGIFTIVFCVLIGLLILGLIGMPIYTFVADRTTYINEVEDFFINTACNLTAWLAVDLVGVIAAVSARDADDEVKDEKYDHVTFVSAEDAER